MRRFGVLCWCGGLVLLVGLLAGVFGLVLFGTAFMTPSSTFFANPHETMDVMRRDSFLGILLVSAAGGLVPIGGLFLAAGFVLRALAAHERGGARSRG